MSSINMNDIEVITSNNLNEKQRGTDQVVIHPSLSVSAHSNIGLSIPNPHQPQPVPIYQNDQHVPVVIMSNGANINNPIAEQIVNIPEYRTWSIFNIIFCCLILGVLACTKSQETREKKRFGNLQGASQASQSAKILNVCATVIGIGIIITVSVLQATKTIKLYSYSYA